MTAPDSAALVRRAIRARRPDPAMATLRLSQDAMKIAALIDAASCALLASSEQQLDDDSAGTIERRSAIRCINDARSRLDALIGELEREG